MSDDAAVNWCGDWPARMIVLMATTQEIVDAAHSLGQLLASHSAVSDIESSVKALQSDVDAQALLNDFNRFVNVLGEKEASGQPIEVADKRKLEALQSSLATNLTVRRFQTSQMDYLDLRRKIDEAIDQELAPAAATAPPEGPGGGPGAGSPLIHPGGMG